MLVGEEVKPFSTSVLTSPFLCLKNRVSGHLLNLASNYILVIRVEQWLHALRSLLVSFYACLRARN